MNMNFYKRVLGTVIIPLVFLLVLLFICQINGRVMIANQVSFTNFVIYAAIIMITTIALSINLNSGRFDVGARRAKTSSSGTRCSVMCLA